MLPVSREEFQILESWPASSVCKSHFLGAGLGKLTNQNTKVRVGGSGVDNYK